MHATSPATIPMCIFVRCLLRHALHCRITRPDDAIPTPLPVDLRQMRSDMPIWPPPWWNGRLQGDEVVEEGPTLGHMEDSDGVPEPTPGPSTSNNVDGRGPNLPSIHTLGLLELGWVSDRQPDPNTLPSPATPISTQWLGTPSLATHPQVPSQPTETNLVPEQDSQCDSQDESSRDTSSEMDSEDTQSGGSRPLSPDLDEHGSSLRWRIYGLSEFAHESSGDSSETDSENIKSGGSSPLSSDFDEHGSDLTWRNFGLSEFAQMYRTGPLLLY